MSGWTSDNGSFALLDHVQNQSTDNNSNENTSHNDEIGQRQKYFKEIAAKMPNIDEIHLTGTGQVQEQFIKFLAATPQYKNAVASESTSNRMSDENLVMFIEKHFN